MGPVTEFPLTTLYPTMTLPNPLPTDVNGNVVGTEAEVGIGGVLFHLAW